MLCAVYLLVVLCILLQMRKRILNLKTANAAQLLINLPVTLYKLLIIYHDIFLFTEPSPSLLDCSKLWHYYEVVRPETSHCLSGPTQAIAESPPTELKRKPKFQIVKTSPHDVDHFKPWNSVTNILPNTPGIKAASSNVLADKSFFNHVNECDNLEETASSIDEKCTQHSEVSTMQYETESVRDSTR